MTITIALGVETALDTETARQLHDYGALDDAGVAAALEQTGLQRHGVRHWPGYLTQIRHVAVIIDDGGDLTLAAFRAETLEQERTALKSLFAIMPDAADGRCVAWSQTDWKLLLQRAYRHQLPAPAPLYAWLNQALGRLFDAHDDIADIAARKDLIRLYGDEAAELAAIAPALRDAVQWYGMDLRRRCVTGGMDAGIARQLAARAATHALQTTDGANA